VNERFVPGSATLLEVVPAREIRGLLRLVKISNADAALPPSSAVRLRLTDPALMILRLRLCCGKAEA